MTPPHPKHLTPEIFKRHFILIDPLTIVIRITIIMEEEGGGWIGSVCVCVCVGGVVGGGGVSLSLTARP